MAVGNGNKYGWRTVHYDARLDNKDIKILYKSEDGGALYRKGLEFSLDTIEVSSRYQALPFDGILLDITKKRGQPCNFLGRYYITYNDFISKGTKRVLGGNGTYKTYVSIKHWTKLEQGDQCFFTSEDKDWALRVQKDLQNGTLTGLKDQSDIKRFQEEYASGVYVNATL